VTLTNLSNTNIVSSGVSTYSSDDKSLKSSIDRIAEALESNFKNDSNAALAGLDKERENSEQIRQAINLESTVNAIFDPEIIFPVNHIVIPPESIKINSDQSFSLKLDLTPLKYSILIASFILSVGFFISSEIFLVLLTRLGLI